MSTRLEDLRAQAERDISDSDSDSELEMDFHPILKALISCATGVVFGVALEKGRVFEPGVIRDQMLLKRFVMVKMFLSASLIGMLCISLMLSYQETKRKMLQAAFFFTKGLQYKTALSAVIGGAMLGSGMAICGACPGTVFIQLGARVPNAWAVIAGGLFGTAIYSGIDSSLPEAFHQRVSHKYYFLNRYFNVSYYAFAIPFSFAMAFVVIGIELIRPWYEEVPESLVTEGFMKAGAWPPFIAGAIVGTLQIPIVLANRDTLGSATSYVTILSQIYPFLKRNPAESYMKKFRHGMLNWWQVFYIGGAVLGSYWSARSSHSLGTVAGLPVYQAFGGGVLLLFGSRLAGGCTSGHGLSGMGLLALLSFATVPAMFAGGIGTAFFMKYVCNVDM